MRKPSKTACTPTFDPEDADLSALKWRLNRGGYPVTTIHGPGGSVVKTAHRMVMERVAGRPLTAGDICDHANLDKADNRRSNLRLVDKFQSAQNRLARGKSGVRGAVYHKGVNRFQAQVAHQGKCYYCGLFDTAEEAGAAAAAKRKELGFLEAVA